MPESGNIGSVLAVCISEKKHTPKKNMGEGQLRAFWGVVGDAHAGEELKQVSLLAGESIRKVREAGLPVRIRGFRGKSGYARHRSVAAIRRPAFTDRG